MKASFWGTRSLNMWKILNPNSNSPTWGFKRGVFCHQRIPLLNEIPSVEAHTDGVDEAQIIGVHKRQIDLDLNILVLVGEHPSQGFSQGFVSHTQNDIQMSHNRSLTDQWWVPDVPAHLETGVSWKKTTYIVPNHLLASQAHRSLYSSKSFNRSKHTCIFGNNNTLKLLILPWLLEVENGRTFER